MHKRIFYGWIILPAGILGILFSIPGQTVGISVFTDFLIEAHSLTRSAIALAYMAGTIASALLLSHAGRLYDRFGARRMGVPTALLLSLTLVILAASDRIAVTAVRITNLPAGMVSFILLVLGFFLVRFFGQGSLTMLSRNMVMKWFSRKRGAANAFLGISVSLGFSAAPGVMDQIIERAGWRGAWQLMAVGLAIFALVILVIYRDSPADIGQLPDGDIPEYDSNADSGNALENRTAIPAGLPIKSGQPLRIARTFMPLPPLPENDFTLAQARRTPIFWLLSLTLALSSILVTAVTFHVVSVFDEMGIARERALALFLPASAAAVAVQFIGSAASNYLRERVFILGQLVGAALIACMSLGSGNLMPQILFIAGVGITQGTMGITGSVVWPRLYGLRNLGVVTGFVTALSVAGSALGPFTYSLFFDIAGSYRGAGLLFLAATSGIAVWALAVKDFTPRWSSR